MISGLGVWIGATVWLFTVDWRLVTAAVVVPVAFWMMLLAELLPHARRDVVGALPAPNLTYSAHS